MVILVDNTMIKGFSAKVFQNNLIKSKDCLIGLLGGYCLTPHSNVFHSYADVTIGVEGLQKPSLCSLLLGFELGVIFIVFE